MPPVRVYFEETSGNVVQVEHRPDGSYDDSNLGDHGEGVVATVVDEPPPANVPFDQLEVKSGKLRVKGRRGAGRMPDATEALAVDAGGDQARIEVAAAAADVQSRVDQIRRLDKTKLSDAEWIALFREYMTLVGGF